MVRSCKVCSHPRRADVDAALLKGTAELDIADTFALTRAAIRKHLGACPLQGKGAKARSRAHGPAEPDEPPASSPRPPVRPVGPRAIGGHEEELRRSLEKLVRASEAADVSPSHLAALGGRILAVTRELRRIEDERGIHEHPAFAAIVEDLISAVVVELGPEAPEGLEARIADRFETLQAARVDEEHAAPKRRAA